MQTGLSLAASDFTICKNSASYAAKNDSTAGGNHVNGMYNMTLDATDTASTGRLDVMVQKTGCLVVWDSFMVLSATVYDALFSTGALLTNVTHWSGTAVATPDTAGYPKVTVKDGTGAGEIDLTSGVVLAKDHAGANLATAAQIAALENVSAAEVKTQVVDALTVDTYAEPGQTAPPATTTILGRLQWIYKAWRNKVDQSGSQYKLYNDAGDTVDNKSALTDDDTVFQKGKVGSGPYVNGPHDAQRARRSSRCGAAVADRRPRSRRGDRRPRSGPQGAPGPHRAPRRAWCSRHSRSEWARPSCSRPSSRQAPRSASASPPTSCPASASRATRRSPSTWWRPMTTAPPSTPPPCLSSTSRPDLRFLPHRGVAGDLGGIRRSVLPGVGIGRRAQAGVAFARAATPGVSFELEVEPGSP